MSKSSRLFACIIGQDTPYVLCLCTLVHVETYHGRVFVYRWLDKLGLAAQNDIKVVVRQVLYDGVDGLLDEKLNIMPVQPFMFVP